MYYRRILSKCDWHRRVGEQENKIVFLRRLMWCFDGPAGARSPLDSIDINALSPTSRDDTGNSKHQEDVTYRCFPVTESRQLFSVLRGELMVTPVVVLRFRPTSNFPFGRNVASV